MNVDRGLDTFQVIKVLDELETERLKAQRQIHSNGATAGDFARADAFQQAKRIVQIAVFRAKVEAQQLEGRHATLLDEIT